VPDRLYRILEEARVLSEVDALRMHRACVGAPFCFENAGERGEYGRPLESLSTDVGLHQTLQYICVPARDAGETRKMGLWGPIERPGFAGEEGT